MTATNAVRANHPWLKVTAYVALMRRRKRLSDEERLVGGLLAAGRIAIGAGIWAAPGLTAKALGMKPFDSEALALARLAATRDVILGAWLGTELRDGGEPLAPAIALTACDAGDALAFALLAARGGDDLQAGARGVAAAGPATAIGAWLVSRIRG
ncbi:MAG: hypothetical protein QOI31_1006 [Solirubrobacterales bacterium]|jgi:hypothetical protein|nr:hypothetical protein [Solirubrobacterales bacterium]